MNVYVFQAALLCEDCGEAAKLERREYEGAEDSDAYPQGPYGDGGGEADSPQHCDSCGLFLDNPLTGDGDNYVRDAFIDYVETGRGNIEVLADWKLAYSWCWDMYVEVSLEMRIEEGKPLSKAEQARFDQLEAV